MNYSRKKKSYKDRTFSKGDRDQEKIKMVFDDDPKYKNKYT